MTTALLIDGMLSGTGVRDATNGGYVTPAELGLSGALADDIASWLTRYEDAHYHGFPVETVSLLDTQGLALTRRVGHELTGRCVGYFSNGKMTRLP